MPPRSTEPDISLRPALPSDCERVWQINNEPSARAASRNPEPIAVDAHRRWFADCLADPGTALHLIVDAASSVLGVIRLERHGAYTELSLAIDREQRGRGVGRGAIRAAVAVSATRWPGLPVHAWVAEDNPASRRCFEEAGFSRVGAETLGSRCFYLYRHGRAEQGTG